MMVKPVTLTPVRPNAGIEAAYRKRLDALIAEMHRSIVYWLKAAWRANEPEMVALAADRSPAKDLIDTMKRLGRRWTKRFGELAPELARYFATSAHKRSDAAFTAALRKAGFTVKFTLSPAVNDIVQAQIGANVALIKSIASEHLTQVQGSVLRSVQAGRDLGTLTDELEAHYGVSRRKAALIARSQNNLATATVTRARQAELGISEAVWLHSGGGRHPRPSHVRAGRERARYSVKEGWFDPDEQKRIWPGELINCRCLSRPVIPGLSPR